MTTHLRISCSILSLFLLSGCAVLRDETPERTVRVKLVADAKLRENDPQWRETAVGLLRAASDFYQHEFGITFVAVAVEPWQLEESSQFVASLLKQLMQRYPSNKGDSSYDVLVGLTGEQVAFYFGGGRGLAILGTCDKGLGNYLVTAVNKTYRYTGHDSEMTLDVVALIHEFGHIFGAEHTQDTNSIMHFPFDYRSDFDAKSRGIVAKNKFCPFAK